MTDDWMRAAWGSVALIWVSVLFIIAAILLLVRSARLLRDPNPPPGMRWFGRVTLMVTALAILLHVLIARGMLVISPEFGIAMVQGGSAAYIGLTAVLLAIGIVVGLGWDACRMRLGRRDCRIHLIVIGIVLSLVSANTVRCLNPESAEPLRIYMYDLWWPPLQLWVVTCLVAVAVAEPMLKHFLPRVFAISFALAVVSLYALLRPDPAGPYSDQMQALVAMVSLALAWGSAAWFAVPWHVRGESIPKAAVKLGAVVVGVGLAVASVLVVETSQLRAVLGAVWPLVLAASWPMLLLVLRARAAWTAYQAARQLIDATARAAFVCVALVAASLAVLFYVPQVPPAIALTVFLLAWIAYTEVLYPDDIALFCKLTITGRLFDDVPVRAVGAGLGVVVGKTAAGARSVLSKVFDSESTWHVTVLKVVAVVLLLVAVAEIPSAGKTIVMAMQTPQKQAAFEGLGQTVADHIANSLAALNEDLLPDLIVLKDLSQDARESRATSRAATSLDASLSKSSDVKLFGETSVPVSVLVAPVQGPMRALLGTRVVYGSLQEGNGKYTLLAESSNGESWKVERERKPAAPVKASDKPASTAAAPAKAPAPKAPSAKAVPDETAKAGDEKGSAKAGEERTAAKGTAEKAAPKATGERTPDDPSPADAIPGLAEQLAFEIRRGDPGLAVFGMTKSWKAFSTFRDGLRHWRAFEVTGSYGELNAAITDFRVAISTDPAFALARYRLALALREDGQPGRAVEELRASLRASPNYLPAISALATTLWDFDNFLLQPPAAFPSRASERGVEMVRHAEARELWQRLVQSAAVETVPVDLASANYGLCLEAITNDTGEETRNAIEFTRKDFTLLTGLLAEQLNGLRTAPEGGQQDRASDDAGTDPVVEAATVAGSLLRDAEALALRSGDLLALAGTGNGDAKGAIEAAIETWRKARQPLRMLAQGSRNGPAKGIERQKLVDQAVEALMASGAAAQGLLAGPVGAGLSFAFQRYVARAADQVRIAYFYCKRGEELYARLPAEQRSAATVRRAEGLVLVQLAGLLERSGSRSYQPAATWNWHCRADDFVDVNDVGREAVYLLGPHAEVALGHYQRAADLLPEDPGIRCSGARVARTLNDEAPMLALKNSVEARSSLGRDWFDRGYAYRNASYLKFALDEYAEAIARNPYHTDSLNAFAYSAYLWRLFNVNGDDPDSAIDPQYLIKAEEHARKAVGLTARGHDLRKRIEARSTLGEVLLAQGRAHEAVEELRSALKDLGDAKAGADHAAFDELRWDLRQAALCAAIVDERTKFYQDARELRTLADDMIKTIKESDQRREYQRFGAVSRANNALENTLFCNEAVADASREETPLRYVLAKDGVKYTVAPQRMCARMWVSSKVQGEIGEELQLVVVGGGNRVAVALSPDGNVEPTAFADFPRDSHHYYFAQLVQGDGGVARSPLYPLQTYERGDCSRNQLVVNFEPYRAEKPKAR